MQKLETENALFGEGHTIQKIFTFGFCNSNCIPFCFVVFFNEGEGHRSASIPTDTKVYKTKMVSKDRAFNSHHLSRIVPYLRRNGSFSSRWMRLLLTRLPTQWARSRRVTTRQHHQHATHHHRRTYIKKDERQTSDSTPRRFSFRARGRPSSRQDELDGRLCNLWLFIEIWLCYALNYWARKHFNTPWSSTFYRV